MFKFVSVVPLIESFEVQSNTPSSIMISWQIPSTSIIDNYTVTLTNLCDNVVLPQYEIDGNFTSLPITGLLSGLQYTVSIKPVNTFGKGMETTDNVTTQENG